MPYILSDDGERTYLECEYDAAEDIMYSWIPPKPRNGVAYETPDGHLVMLDPATHELVGVTIFDYNARWGGGDRKITLEWEVPERAFFWRTRDKRVERVLQPA